MSNLINEVNEFLDYISKKVELPQKGFLAGASIGNYLLAKKRGVEPIINDVDIFYGKESETIYDAYSIRNEFYKNIIQFNEIKKKMIISNPDYRHTSYIKTTIDNYYKIIDTRVDGLLNFVKYESNDTSLDFLVKTFDINSTKIGIDLATRNIVITDDYLNFYNNEILEVVNPRTPCHSLLRIIKKSEELNIKCDIQKEIERAKFSYKLTDLPTRTYFSNKYLNLYKNYEHILGDHFKLSSYKKLRDKSKPTLGIHEIYTMLPIATESNLKYLEVGYNKSKEYVSAESESESESKSSVENDDYNNIHIFTRFRSVEDVNYFIDYAYGDLSKSKLCMLMSRWSFKDLLKDIDLSTTESKNEIVYYCTWLHEILNSSKHYHRSIEIRSVFRDSSLKQTIGYLKWFKEFAILDKKYTDLLYVLNTSIGNFDSKNELKDFLDLMMIKYRKELFNLVIKVKEEYSDIF